MDLKRAKEIASSPVMANVTYNGTRVYIKSVNENSGTANIHPLQQCDNRIDVPVTNLTEH
jgi:small acid-soluble spore protein H (minor)